MDNATKTEITRNKLPSLHQLKLAVLKNEYGNATPFFSRQFLWKSVCLNSYNIQFDKDELKPVPATSTDDPLQHDTEEDETLRVIKLDVERLIIDPIFMDESIQNDVIQILFNYNNFTPYKQGYHEICGLVYLQLYNDLTANISDDKIVDIKQDLKIETFNIFTSLMISIVPTFYNEDNLIGWCISQFNKYLLLIDPQLYTLLVKNHKIESQIWLIRWVRLLFLRELGLENTVGLLDKLICYDHDLSKLFPFIIVLFLIKIKVELVQCEDSGEILYLLLHYPYKVLNDNEIKEIVDLSIKLYKAQESNLEAYGIAINKKYNKQINWDKLKDLDRLRMELKLQKRVTRALKLK